MTNILENWKLIKANETITLSEDFAYWLNPSSNVKEVRVNKWGYFVNSGKDTVWNTNVGSNGLTLKSGTIEFSEVGLANDIVYYRHPGLMNKAWKINGFYPENFITPDDKVIFARYFVRGKDLGSIIVKSNGRYEGLKKRFLDKETRACARAVKA